MDESKADVLVIAGTYDARRIISELTDLNLKVATTITTKFGNELIDSHPNVRVFQKKLTAQGMARVIKMFDAKCLIDASHPFAVESSSSAMKACEKTGIKYLRYEQSQVKFESKQIINVKSYEDAAKQVAVIGGNILLSIGSKNLETFFENIPDFQSRLYVRILPDSEVIAKCEKMGLPRSNIIAMKGPISEELNLELLKHMDAKVLITKDSGVVGGTDQKVRAAERLGIKTILIARPGIDYKDRVGTISEAIFWIGNALASGKTSE